MSLFDFFRKRPAKKIEPHRRIVTSILTGIPVQTRMGGQLTEAGVQQQIWCNEMLEEMNATQKDYVSRIVLGTNRKITRKEVETQLKRI